MDQINQTLIGQINKLIIQQMMEAVEHLGLAAQADFFADQVNNHGDSVPREAIRGILDDIAATFPDVRFELLATVAEGDWVAARCFFCGTHLGVSQHPLVHAGLLFGVAPTGKRVRVHHIHLFRLEGGLIIEHWAVRDDLDLLEQLGLPLRRAVAETLCEVQ